MPCVLWIFSWKFVQMKAYIFGFQKMYTLSRVWAGEHSNKSVQSEKMWHPPLRCYLSIFSLNHQKLSYNLKYLKFYTKNLAYIDRAISYEHFNPKFRWKFWKLQMWFFSWHTSRNWQQRQIFGNLGAMSKTVMFLTIRISSSM